MTEFAKRAPNRRAATADAIMRLRKADAIASLERNGYWTDINGDKRTDTVSL